jgi:hypothetical protein
MNGQTLRRCLKHFFTTKGGRTRSGPATVYGMARVIMPSSKLERLESGHYDPVLGKK